MKRFAALLLTAILLLPVPSFAFQMSPAAERTLEQMIDTAGHLTLLEFYARSAPALSASGRGTIYYDTSANKFKVSENAGAYANLAGAGLGDANAWTALQTFGAGILLGSNDTLAWGNAVGGGTADTGIERLSAAVLALNNGTTGGGLTLGRLQVGRLLTGTWEASSSFAVFGNSALNQALNANYALIQDTAGATMLNAPTGQVISLRINNVDSMTISGSDLLPASTVSSLGSATRLWKQFFGDYTNTATIGAVQIDKMSGRVNMAAAATTFTVTNSLVTAASHIFLTPAFVDATCKAPQAVAAAGSFTVNCAAATANTAINFLVINAD